MEDGVRREGRGLPCSTRLVVVPAAAAAAETLAGAVVCLPTARHTQTHTYAHRAVDYWFSTGMPTQHQNCLVHKNVLKTSMAYFIKHVSHPNHPNHIRHYTAIHDKRHLFHVFCPTQPLEQQHTNYDNDYLRY